MTQKPTTLAVMTIVILGLTGFTGVVPDASATDRVTSTTDVKQSPGLEMDNVTIEELRLENVTVTNAILNNIMIQGEDNQTQNFRQFATQQVTLTGTFTNVTLHGVAIRSETLADKIHKNIPYDTDQDVEINDVTFDNMTLNDTEIDGLVIDRNILRSTPFQNLSANVTQGTPTVEEDIETVPQVSIGNATVGEINLETVSVTGAKLSRVQEANTTTETN